MCVGNLHHHWQRDNHTPAWVCMWHGNWQSSCSPSGLAEGLDVGRVLPMHQSVLIGQQDSLAAQTESGFFKGCQRRAPEQAAVMRLPSEQTQSCDRKSARLQENATQPYRLYSDFRRSFFLPMSYRRTMGPTPTSRRPLKAVRAPGMPPKAVLWTSSSLRPLSTSLYSRTKPSASTS